MGIAVRGGATDVVAADDDGRPLGAIFEGTAEQLAVDAVVARRRMLEFGAKRRPVFAQNEPPEPGRAKHYRLDDLRPPIACRRPQNVTERHLVHVPLESRHPPPALENAKPAVPRERGDPTRAMVPKPAQR